MSYYVPVGAGACPQERYEKGRICKEDSARFTFNPLLSMPLNAIRAEMGIGVMGTLA
jgi:hypothetical protein